MIYTEGRVWATDFSNPVADAALFDLTNYSYVTLDGAQVLQATTRSVASTILTQASDVAAAEVYLRYRLQTDSTYSNDYGPGMVVRWTDLDHCWLLNNRFQNVNQTTGCDSKNLPAPSVSAANITNPDGENVTVWRNVRWQVFADVCRYRIWLDGSPEPTTWTVQERLRVSSITQSNTEIGKAGLRSQFSKAAISNLKITELVRWDDSFVSNGDLAITLTSPANTPAFWAAGTPASLATVIGPNGVERPALKISAGTFTAGFWTQRMYLEGLVPNNPFFTRDYLHPAGAWRSYPEVEVSLWSKGVSVVRQPASEPLGAAAILYYYGEDGSTLMAGRTDYYATLGPNGGVGGGTDRDGTGSWGWYRTSWTLPLANYQKIVNIRLDVGFHAACTGELYVLDVEITPLAGSLRRGGWSGGFGG